MGCVLLVFPTFVKIFGSFGKLYTFFGRFSMVVLFVVLFFS